MGATEFINHDIQMYYLVKVDHKGMVVHLTKSAL